MWATASMYLYVQEKTKISKTILRICFSNICPSNQIRQQRYHKIWINKCASSFKSKETEQTMPL